MEQQIIATVAYFDMFDRPLTEFEIFRYLLSNAAILEKKNLKNAVKLETQVEQKIDAGKYQKTCTHIQLLIDQKKLAEKDGMIMLFGREATTAERNIREIISKPKWDRAVRATKIIRYVPFVRMVAICNTLAYNMAKKDSDIDLLIVIKKDRIWMSRLTITSRPNSIIMPSFSASFF